ncbi:MAG: disulfide bond formation protein B [gamma proteobacterium symbiont of Taylorina sp.]|nr:disulfide bond formation protein B [gamma proteobacterium symbiont of Taylorina sp.]
MIKNILSFSKSRWYWLGLLVLSINFEAIALFYQYGLEYAPCVLCIHVRILVLGIFTISILGILFFQNNNILFLAHITMTGLMAGLFERSYQLFGTERGFIDGGCSMESGLPNWFALDKWMPLIFKVWEPCGYTPELLFGVTMAEALIVLSFFLLMISSIFIISLIAARVAK